MKIANLCLVVGVVSGFPVVAAAQQNAAEGRAADIKYCNALVRSYQSTHPVQQGMPASDAVTLTRCDSDPRPTIAELERKLTDRKITLPPNDRGVAQQPPARGNQR
jgi:hypothetical protein